MTTLDDKDFYLYAEQPALYIIESMAKSSSKKSTGPLHKVKAKWTKLKQENDRVLAKLSEENGR